MKKAPYKMNMKSYGAGKNPIMMKSPMKDEDAKKNLLNAVPNEEAYNKLSDKDKKGFDKAAKRAGLPMRPKE